MKDKVFVAFIGFLLVTVGSLELAGQEQLLRTTNRFSRSMPPVVDEDAGHTFRVRVEQGDLIEVVAESTTVDTWIDAELPDGTTIQNDDYRGLDAGFMRMMPATGQLVLRVSALYHGAEGPYTLIVTRHPGPQRITLGQRVEGRLQKGATRSRWYADTYVLEGEAGDRIVVDMHSTDLDSFLEILDPRGRTYFDDDGGRGYDSRLAYEFEESGSVIITATSALRDSMGVYELQVSRLDRTLVARYEGRLRATGRRAYDGKLFEVYEYNGRVGQFLTIGLESDAFDPVVYVSYSDGRPLAMDDDSGAGTNSLLDVVLPSTDTYRIYVTPFAEGEGAYRLSIFE